MKAYARRTWALGSHAPCARKASAIMSVQITRSDRRPFKSGDAFHASPEELKDAFDGYFGHFGTYTVDERAGTVTHQVEGAFYPNYVGTDHRRFFTWQARLGSAASR